VKIKELIDHKNTNAVLLNRGKKKRITAYLKFTAYYKNYYIMI